jgi:hypothetical protein
VRDEPPLVGRAVGLLAGLRQPLNLPVDRPERLAHVGVDRSLLVAPDLVLMDQEAGLRDRDIAIDPYRVGEGAVAEGAQFACGDGEPAILRLDGFRRDVAQCPVDIPQRRVETGAAEIRVGGGIALQELDHVAREHPLDELVAGSLVAELLRAGYRAAGGRQGTGDDRGGGPAVCAPHHCTFSSSTSKTSMP